MSSRRLPLTVYSVKRRQRSISNPHARPVPSSSPLKPLAHDEDITVEEMSRRMMKRSRSGLKRSYSGPDPFKSASVGASPIDRPLEDTRPTKRSKASIRAPLQTIVEPSHSSMDEEGTADMDLTDIAELKTPVPRDNITEKQNDTKANEETDFLSPLPSSRLAKRVIAHRTSSSNLAENKAKKSNPTGDYMLLSPASSDLASPFHSRPGSPNPNRHAVKNALNKKLNRTRSVGTDLRRRATMRSLSRAVSPASNASSPGARRHPSLPISQGAQKENQDWLVPAQLKKPLGQLTPRRPSETGVPFVRESSFFDSVPEACSTPVHSKRNSPVVPPTPGRDIDATPRVPLGRRLPTAYTHNLDFMLEEPTPRARPTIETIPSGLLPAEDSLFPDSPTIPAEEAAREPYPIPRLSASQSGMSVHVSEDSIFSSALGLSTSTTIKPRFDEVHGISESTKVDPGSVTLAPPSSPVPDLSPASSEGDELRDMFSILGLDEDEHWLASSSSRVINTDKSMVNLSSASTAGKKKKLKSTLPARRSNAKHEVINVKARVARVGGPTPASSVSNNLGRRRRVLITTESPTLACGASKASRTKQVVLGSTILVRTLDKPIQAASDSSDEIDFLSNKQDSVDKIKFLQACSGQTTSGGASATVDARSAQNSSDGLII